MVIIQQFDAVAALVRGYLLRRRETLEEIVATVPVFSKRYNEAVDELEEVSDLLGLEDE